MRLFQTVLLFESVEYFLIKQIVFYESMKITISGCTVHAYDPSTQVKMNSDAAKYPNLHYHKIGIGKANAQFLKNNAKILYGTKICTIEPQISGKRAQKI